MNKEVTIIGSGISGISLAIKLEQNNIKDIDLLLITLQALIPTLQYDDKQQLMRNLNMDNLYTILGKTSEKNKVLCDYNSNENNNRSN